MLLLRLLLRLLLHRLLLLLVVVLLRLRLLLLLLSYRPDPVPCSSVFPLSLAFWGLQDFLNGVCTNTVVMQELSLIHI